MRIGSCSADFQLAPPRVGRENAESDPEADFLVTLADNANLDL